MIKGSVILIPTFLHEDALHTLPSYIVEEVKKCDAFFVEQEKTARRFLKKIWREINIDQYIWHTIHKAEDAVISQFKQLLQQGKHIGIISEAGCPGIADPGQILVKAAQAMQAVVKPLVGPSSILLALMASGMNGQHFKFNGYLPIDATERKKKLKELEQESYKHACTQIFIETPYRNNQLIKDVLDVCRPETQFCIAIDITAAAESIQTKNIQSWKKSIPDVHKRLGIFLLNAS